MKKILVLAMLVGSFSAFAQTDTHKEKMKEDRQAIDKACSAEATTAGCGSEKVGTGLIHCIAKYKHTHKDFKISEGCQTARKQWRDDRSH